MGIVDKAGEIADATALSTAGTGLALVGSQLDLSVVRNVSAPGNKPLYLVISVDTAVLSAGSATVEFQLVSDSTAAIAVDGSATVHAKTGAIPKASLGGGVLVMVLALPSEPPAYERFLGLLQNVGTAALTAGKINAYLTAVPPGQNRSYPDAT